MDRSEEHTSELQSPCNLVCRLLLEKKKNKNKNKNPNKPNAVCPTSKDLTPRGNVRCRVLCTLSCRAGLVFGFFFFFFFFFNDPATPEIYPLPLHDALPICHQFPRADRARRERRSGRRSQGRGSAI